MAGVSWTSSPALTTALSGPSLGPENVRAGVEKFSKLAVTGLQALINECFCRS